MELCEERRGALGANGDVLNKQLQLCGCYFNVLDVSGGCGSERHGVPYVAPGDLKYTVWWFNGVNIFIYYLLIKYPY